MKHISETIKSRAVPRKVYDSVCGGLSIHSVPLISNDWWYFTILHAPFYNWIGVVVTLKEMNGVNRIDDFIKLCMTRGWLVNKLDVESRIDIYLKAEEEIEFE